MKSITVVHDNYTGLLADVTDLLTERGINLSDIHVELLGTTGLIRLDTDQVNEALEALTTASYNAVAEESVLVRLKDEPGALARVSRQLAEQQVDIRGMNVVGEADGYSVVAITCAAPARAREILSAVTI